MIFSKRNATSLMLALLSLCNLISAQQSTAQGNCSSFSWDQQPAYYKYNSQPQRVSMAVNCSAGRNMTHMCALSAVGDVQSLYNYNLTSQISDPEFNRADTGTRTSYLLELLRRQVNDSMDAQSLNISVIGIIDTTTTILPGTAAYLNFTQLSRCYAGTLNNCSGGLRDGLGLEICSPVYHTTRVSNDAIPILDGRYDQVNISEADVSQYPNPFIGQARGRENGAFSQHQTNIFNLLGVISLSFIATIFI